MNAKFFRSLFVLSLIVVLAAFAAPTFAQEAEATEEPTIVYALFDIVAVTPMGEEVEMVTIAVRESGMLDSAKVHVGNRHVTLDDGFVLDGTRITVIVGSLPAYPNGNMVPLTSDDALFVPGAVIYVENNNVAQDHYMFVPETLPGLTLLVVAQDCEAHVGNNDVPMVHGEVIIENGGQSLTCFNGRTYATDGSALELAETRFSDSVSSNTQTRSNEMLEIMADAEQTGTIVPGGFTVQMFRDMLANQSETGGI